MQLGFLTELSDGLVPRPLGVCVFGEGQQEEEKVACALLHTETGRGHPLDPPHPTPLRLNCSRILRALSIHVPKGTSHHQLAPSCVRP